MTLFGLRPHCARARLGLVGLLAAAALAAGVLPPTAARASTDAQCAAGTTYTWTGAVSSSWDVPGNWDRGCVPGLETYPDGRAKPQDDRVIIPAGASVTLDDSTRIPGTVTNSGTLTISPSGRLSTRLPSTSRHLVLRGLLFGTGDLTITYRLDWQSTAVGAAATMSTRRCGDAPYADCLGTAPTDPGRTIIAAGAVAKIDRLGVNLRDHRVLENRGRLVLSGMGFLAADRGTALRNLRLPGAPEPVYEIRNDGWYDQGFLPPGEPLSAFTNTGLVLKNGTGGRSIIDAGYRSTDPATSATGRVVVRTGQLSISTAPPTADHPAPVRSALVQPGAGFGDAGKDGTTGADPQAAAVQLPSVGTELVPVSLQQLPPTAGTLGVHVEITTPGAMTAQDAPLVFRLYLDSSKRAGRTPAQIAATTPVYRQARQGSPVLSLPACSVSLPTAGQACVDRPRSSSETSALQQDSATSGDVVLVVKSLQNSRYKY